MTHTHDRRLAPRHNYVAPPQQADPYDAAHHPENWAHYRAPNGRLHTLNRSMSEMLTVLEKWGWVEVVGGGGR